MLVAALLLGIPGLLMANSAIDSRTAGGDAALSRDVAQTVWYQGFIADVLTGEPVNATYDITVSLYDSDSGGTQIWGAETHADVVIAEGWFNIELGSTATLPAFDDPPYYLQLTVNGEVMSPRQKLASVPSALRSGETDALDDYWSLSGNDIYHLDGHVGIGHSTPLAKLDVTTDSGRAGDFRSSYEGIDMHVLHAEFTGDVLGYTPIAVYGRSKAGLGDGYGGYFEGGFTGVRGEVMDGTPYESFSFYGVNGLASVPSGTNYGVSGRADRGATNCGVRGSVVIGSGENYGVAGEAGASGATKNIGVSGVAILGQMNYGVYGYAPDYAGYFNGDVTVTGTLTEGGGVLRIDHPLDPANKYLSHSFVVSSDVMSVYNGNVLLDGMGEAWVELPEWFEALNRDFRYQLTAIGAPAPDLYVAAEIVANRFRIAGGRPGAKVSWQITGIRHDAYAEMHRVPTEADKPAQEVGRYLHPEAYHLPETMSIGYDLRLAREEATKMTRRP
jgi:hypothetical protein